VYTLVCSDEQCEDVEGGIRIEVATDDFATFTAGESAEAEARNTVCDD